MKDIFSLKKNKIKSSQMLFLKACYSYRSRWLRLASTETGILPKMAFLSLQFVISESLLSSF